MAMVVWLFAGGGESEIEGLVPFLVDNFPGCKFERKTPVKSKPGPKVEKTGGHGHADLAKSKKTGPKRDWGDGYGHTGRGLANQIKERLKSSLERGQLGDLILVIDDLDCRDSADQEKTFLEAISKVPGAAAKPQCVGFAAPEIEAWIIADWDNTIARHPDFKGCHERMRYWLSTNEVFFSNPESFSKINLEGDACENKLSEVIIESSKETNCKERYRKGIHTPELIKKINPDTVSSKCPHFKKLYNYLQDFCDQRESQMN
ncbi:MAG: DUF4276 family protein [Deltaproteobacteria bacterium]|nr:DUF4276 family protein [Deltaproteobacteria bacterium]MBF0526815.1 DUF4276 family protein [Deltaproteobacteria bacterium]